MNKPTLITLLILLAVAPASAQNWQALNVPTDDGITGIDALGADTLYVCTNGGEFGRSYDRGQTWEFDRVDFEIDLQDIAMIPAGHGLTCGQRGALYRTSDGGLNWTNIALGDTTEMFFSVEMFDDRRGLLVGMERDEENPYAGVAYTTADGGETWTRHDDMGMGFSEIAYDPASGTAVFPGYGQLIWTRDQGRSFQQKLTTEEGLARSVAFEDSTILLVGPQGFISISHNGGESWNTSRQKPTDMFLTAVVVDSSRAYAAGAKAGMLYTANGGRSWDKQLLARSFDVFVMELIGDRIYAAGSEGAMIYKTVE